MNRSIGWDIGGANLKLAITEDGRVTEVAQIPCPIRPDRSKFDDAVAEALKRCIGGERHAVTMTGELSDVFTDRADGVAYIVSMMRRMLAGSELLVYGGRAGFLFPEQAMSRAADVASANWHASAALVARHCREALLVDIGTTTTDVVPILGGVVAARGYTDGERLGAGELVYAGVVRTPVMAMTRRAPFRGVEQGIAAERFATMADVYRLTGDLSDDADPYPAADLRGKSAAESTARLARMLGRDGCEADIAEWVMVARFFADCQLQELEQRAGCIIEREQLATDAPVLGAGCGRFLARELAARLQRPYRAFGEVIDCAAEAREMAARCAPAVAVALLAAKEASFGKAETEC